MGSLDGRWLGPARWLVLSAAVVSLSGCRTAPPALFNTSGPGWRVQQGQALWRPGRTMPELGGEIILASHADGRCVVQFDKTPLPLVLGQTSRTNWLVQFPARRMSFSGRGAPPARLAWLYLGAALAHERLPSSFKFQLKPDGGWRLDNVRSGESIEGFLAP
jgi:hypothetical protein